MADILIPGLVTQLTPAYSTIYTVPVATKAVVTFFRVTNVTGVPVTLRLHIVPGGSNEEVSNAIIYDMPIPGVDFIDMGKGLLLSAETFIRASASIANSLNIKVDVIESS